MSATHGTTGQLLPGPEQKGIGKRKRKMTKTIIDRDGAELWSDGDLVGFIRLMYSGGKYCVNDCEGFRLAEGFTSIRTAALWHAMELA